MTQNFPCMNTVGAWVNSADTPRRVRLCKGTRHTRQNPVSPLSFPRLSVQLLSWRFASLREIKTVVRKTDGEGAVATHRTRPASQLARSASVPEITNEFFFALTGSPSQPGNPPVWQDPSRRSGPGGEIFFAKCVFALDFARNNEYCYSLCQKKRLRGAGRSCRGSGRCAWRGGSWRGPSRGPGSGTR